MEVEEETSVTDLGDDLHSGLPSTVGMDYTNTQDMTAEEAGSGGDMLGFGLASLTTTDLPGTCVRASLCQPDTQLIINLDTLGRSEVTMPGDDADMQVEEASAATTAPRRPRGNRTKSANSNRKHAARQY